jgi:DNA-binding transcriptional regulator GbsR (MarR family)
MVMRKRAEVRRLQHAQMLQKQAAERQRALEVAQQFAAAAATAAAATNNEDAATVEAARQALEKSNAELASIEAAQAAEQAAMERKQAEEDAKLTAALDAKLSHQRVDHHAAAGSVLSVCLIPTSPIAPPNYVNMR